MPIASDASTGGRAAEVDRDIIAAATAAAAAATAAASGGRGAPKAPELGPTSSSIIGPQRSNFVPDADLTRGLHLVNDIPPVLQYGPVISQGAGREPNDYDRMLGLAAVTEQRQDQAQRQRTSADQRSSRPDQAAERDDQEPYRSRYGPERSGGLMRAKRGKLIENIQQRLGDLGMFAGATTTVPEVEQAEQTGSTGVPAWDQRIEEALNPGRSPAPEPSYGAGARAGSSIRLEAPDADTELELSKDRAGLDRRVQNRALGRRQKRTDALTSEEYDALTPKQRAAVDLNTLLVTAVREDLAARKGKKDNPNAGGKAYDAKVAEVFGEKGAASAPYAPRTMELLDNVDFNVEGSNLDDVLKLKVGLNAEDIADLDREQRGGPDLSLDTSMKRRDDLTDALVSSFRQTRRDPQRGAALLETQRDLLNTREAIDFGNPATNQMIDGVFEMLANPNSEIPADKLMAEVKATLTEPDWQTFIRYLDLRSTEAQQYGRPLGVDPEVDYMGARRFRRRFEL